MNYRSLVAAAALCITSHVMAALEAPSRSFTFVYETLIKDVTPDAKQVRVWIPVPMDNADQRITNIRLELTADGKTVVTDPDGIDGIRTVGQTVVHCTLAGIEHGWGRTLCVETSGKPIAIRMTFDCTRRESTGGGSATAEDLAMAIQPDTMIPLDRKVARIANDLPDEGDVVITGRELYDYVLGQMRYDKPAGGAWGRGDSEWACDSRFGNCTDFHSYFIGLARTKHIPARFEMGFSVPDGDETQAVVGGYHCWAFFYDTGRGWIPVDISEADKHADKTEYFFGHLDANRVTMTGGRDLLLTPQPTTGSINFLVYPYLEVDGKDCSGTNIEKSFSRTNK